MSSLNENEKLRETMPDVNTLRPADQAGLKDRCPEWKEQRDNEQLRDAAYKKILSEMADKLYDRRARKDKATKKIRTKDFLTDIRSGMSDNDLMDKHDLNERQFQSALRKMIKAGELTTMEVARRLYITESQTFTALIEADQLQWAKSNKRSKKKS
jgi:hypothetical protein